MEENLNKEIEKGKNKYSLILIIIAVLIVILSGVFIYLNLAKKDSQNIYYKTIDSFASSLKENLGNAENNLNKIIGNDASIAFNIKTTNKEYTDLANVINKMSLQMSSNVDYHNKLLSSDINILYNNKDLLKAKVLADNDKMYADLDTLYNKVIRIDGLEDALNVIWQEQDFDKYNIIIDEFVKELKKALNENYFTFNETNLNVLGSDRVVYEHILSLSKEELYNIETNLLDGLKSNTQFLENIAAVTNTKEEDIIKELMDAKNNLTEPETGIEVKIYINKKTDKLEQAELSINDSKMTLIKEEEDKFNIMVDEEKLGDVIIKEGSFTLNIISGEDNLTINTEKEKLELKLNSTEISMSIKIEGNENDAKIELDINMPSENTEAIVTITSKKKEVTEVAKFDTSKAISINDLSEDDYNTMLENITNNKTLLELIQDIASLSDAM